MKKDESKKSFLVILDSLTLFEFITTLGISEFDLELYIK